MSTRPSCPQCGTPLRVLLFLGVVPEFLTCPECLLAYPLEEQPTTPVATVIAVDLVARRAAAAERLAERVKRALTGDPVLHMPDLDDEDD